MIPVFPVMIGIAAAMAYILFLFLVAKTISIKKNLAVGLIVATLIYVVFAFVWGDDDWVMIELGGVPLYGLFVFLGFKHSPNWLAIGWAAHTVWDLGLHFFGPGKDVAPHAYQIMCAVFDLVIASFAYQNFNPKMQTITTRKVK